MMQGLVTTDSTNTYWAPTMCQALRIQLGAKQRPSPSWDLHSSGETEDKQVNKFKKKKKTLQEFHYGTAY